MRICLISREYPPDTGWGGIGAYTFQHARALKEQGHDVEVISLTAKEAPADSFRPADPSDPGSVPVHRAVWGPLFQELTTVWISLPYTHLSLKSSFALWRKFMEVHSLKPFDVVEAPEHLGEALFPALTHICPLVLRLHTPHSKLMQERYHNINSAFDQELVAILERMTMLEADLLSSPSEDLAAYVASDTGVKSSSIEIVRNPVDCQNFTPDGPQAIAPDGRVTVFFAGRLEERKGMHFLVEAVPIVLKSCPKTRFLIVGADTNTGPGKTSVLAALKQKLSASGGDAAVQFISHVALERMAAHYRSADMCVVPSLYENAPYTVLEAQACGKPVVGTAAGGSKEYIADGETGYVVPPSDAQSLAESIIKLVADQGLRRKMGEAARQRSLAKFDRKIIVGQALASYELAVTRYQSQVDTALYKRSVEQSLRDFVSLMYAYHLNLCDLVYRHSLEYRVKTWLQLAFKRPRLCGAKIALGVLKGLRDNFGLASPPVENLIAKIATQVSEREAEKERLILQALMQECKI
ncbi:MAG: glycosyltransferase family 4 protein [Cyanobacteria bacterium REEB67]|nr:glycosyltransferase family 4 protein [Cyanobacteria bacterium REEB67]